MAMKISGIKEVIRSELSLLKGKKKELLLAAVAILMLGLPIFASANHETIQSVAAQLQEPFVSNYQPASEAADDETLLSSIEGFDTEAGTAEDYAVSNEAEYSDYDTSELAGIAPLYAGADHVVTDVSQLQPLITAATSGPVVIAINANLTLTAPLTIEAGRDVTLVSQGSDNLTSGTGGPRRTIFAPPGTNITNPIPQGGNIAANMGFAARSAVNAPRHVYVSDGSALTLVNLVICASNVADHGGGIEVSSAAGATGVNRSVLNIRGNAVIQNCQQVFGGGVLTSNALLNMSHNAQIAGNSASAVFNSDTVGFHNLPTQQDTPVPPDPNLGRFVNLANGNNTILGGGVYMMDASEAEMQGTAQIRENAVALTFTNTHAIPLNPDQGPGSGVNPNAIPVTTSYTLNGSGNGGGVYMSDGNFTMQGSARIEQNQVTGAFTTNVDGMNLEINHNSSGGGIFLRNGAVFEMEDESQIAGNTTTWISTPVPPIPPLPPLDLWDMASRALHQQHRRTIATTWLGNGGGAYLTGAGATLTMVDASLSRNRAQVPGGVNGGGAGVFADMGATLNMSGTATIGGSDLSYENSFSSTAGSGAGVFIHQAHANLSGHARISHNHTRNTATGGGMRIAGNNTIVVIEDYASVTDNRAGVSGGGIQMVHGNVTVRGNARVERNRVLLNNNGAGINVENGIIDFGGESVIRNHVTNNTDATQGTSVAPQPTQNGAGVRITNGDFHLRDEARIYDNIANISGGGVWMSGGRFHMHGGAIEDNIAYGHIDATGGGGGVFMQGNATFNFYAGRIQNNSVATNPDANTAVGTESIRSGFGGGGVFMTGNSTFNMGTFVPSPMSADDSADGGVAPAGTVLDAVISDNILGRTAATAQPNTGGGGVRMQGGTFNLNGGEIRDHGSVDADNAILDGGGVFIGGGTFRMGYNNAPFAGAISDNVAVNRGGGVFVASTTGIRRIDNDARIADNTAGSDGGGIFLTGGSFAINDATLADNTADNRGGSVFATAGTVTMDDGLVTGSQAIDGGGLYLATAAILDATETSFTANQASEMGGAIFTERYQYESPLNMTANPVPYSNLILTDVAFSGNTANAAHTPPIDVFTDLPNITFVDPVSNFWHPLNNSDINYRSNISPPTGLNVGNTTVAFVVAGLVLVGALVGISVLRRKLNQ